MKVAKKVVGGGACIMGNVPVSLLCTGSSGQIKDHCRKLIDACAPGGGYILAGAASVGEVSQDNLRAMTESVREYGVYKK